MKKLLLLLGAVLVFSACTTEEYYIEETQMNRIIKDFEVKAGDWQEGEYEGPGHELHYFYSFSFPELNNFLYNNGTIVAYYEYTANGNKFQQALPVVRPRQNTSNPDDMWTQVINYEYTQGAITFKVTNDDFNYGNPPQEPGYMLFRVVILW